MAVALPFGAIHSASSVNSAAIRSASRDEKVFQALSTMSLGLVTMRSLACVDVRGAF
jgi:hypothetical protein